MSLTALTVSGDSWPDERRRTKIARHPDADVIHTLIRSGKTAEWISRWLKSRYPTEDEMGVELDEAVRNKRWQLTAATITRYRETWMPECSAGIDVLDPELEKALGPRLPIAGQMGSQFEMDVLETVIQASMSSLGRAIKSDNEMEMLQSVTLEASKTLLETVRTRVELAQSLGIAGYEKAPDVVHQKIDQNVVSRNLNVEVYGNIGRDGQPQAREPAKVQVLRELMAMGPEQAAAVINAAESVVEAQVVDAIEVEEL